MDSLVNLKNVNSGSPGKQVVQIWKTNFLIANFRQDQHLNSIYNQSEFTLDEGEKLLIEMQHLRLALSQHKTIVETLVKRSHEVVPLKQRRQVSSKGQILNVTAICNYKSIEVFRKDWNNLLVHLVNSVDLLRLKLIEMKFINSSATRQQPNGRW
jgi:hypothetical protein